jgi:hypothetical protein
MLLILVVIECALARHELELAGSTRLASMLGAQAAQHEAPRADVLYLGDSLMKHGVQPKVIESLASLRGFNLALPGAQPPVTYFMLRRAHRAGARPKIVVLDFAHDMLAGGPEYSVRNWTEVADAPGAVELALRARNVSLLGSWISGQIAPSARCRVEVRESIVTALRGGGSVMSDMNRQISGLWAANAGAHVEAGSRGDHSTLSDADARRLLAERWWCNGLNREYIKGLFRLAMARSEHVVWLIPPVAPALQSRRAASGADGKYTAFAHAVQAEFPQVVVVDCREAGFDDDAFVDHIHLNRRGAQALSERLAEILGSLVNRSCERAWIDLPALRERMVSTDRNDADPLRLAMRPESRVAR